MNNPLLTINHLSTWFKTNEGEARAVDGVSFSLQRGETFALLGESGCGKSMTALSVMRLVPEPAGRIVSGEVLLHGQNLLSLTEREMQSIRGRKIGMIFQEPQSSLNPVMSVGKQIKEVLDLHFSLSKDQAKRRTIELLELVRIPDPARRYGEYPHQLSGGMKQRIMIAMALAGEPEILIADEPTTALDVTTQAQILSLLKQLQQDTGMAMLLITHDLGVVAQIADRVAVMYAGHLVELATQQEFFTQVAHPYAKKLFASLPTDVKRDRPLEIIRGSVPKLTQDFVGCRFANRCDFVQAECESSAPPWQQLGEEHHARCFFPGHMQSGVEQDALSIVSADPAAEGVKLEIKNLQVHFPIHKGLMKRTAGYVYAVDGIDLTLDAGKTLALVGESGCGKTTVGKAILQLIRPTAGEVNFNGQDLTKLSESQLRPMRRDFQFIFQDPYSSMNPRMLVEDILLEGMLAQNIGETPQQRAERVKTLLERVGLPPQVGARYPHEFSGGQRQRICIARALAVEPKLIVCDEPTSALDVSVQAQILNLLKELQVEHHLSYLFITHNLSVVEYLADEVAVMYLGRIVEQGKVHELLDSPKHPYTIALLAAVPKIEEERSMMKLQLGGEIPSPSNPPQGCHFHPRCAHATEQCRQSYPTTSKISNSHVVRCHLFG